MFVLSRNVSAGYRVIATLVATALVLWAIGAHSYAQAANVTHLYDLLSDSAPAAVSDHEIEFVSPAGVANAETIVITFPAEFLGIAAIDSGDVDLLVNGTPEDIEGGDWTVTTDATSITLTSAGGTIGAGATTTILVGLNADNEGSPDAQITNPSPAGGNGSYEIDISAGADSGHTRVVILDTVEVTANIETTFTFVVDAVSSSTLLHSADTTTLDSSSTTIPFGTLVADQPEVLAQDLTVNTNAIHGFIVTLEEDQHLLSETGADIDNFVEGVTTDQPVAWAAPNDTISDENTWGHWGITSEDFDTHGHRTNEFADSTWAGVSTTPQVVFAHDGPADGATEGEGITTIGFKVEISALQEAADDYSTTLTYIATPTF